mmetsp:Transcript_18690/g.58053  ORF Transcript_18690/g.58053 Transcript_18690/m.58053 type:complete len:343 (+) Transcript_18690:838-1866(+)
MRALLARSLVGFVLPTAAARLLCHDDLVHAQHCDNRVCGQLHRPVLDRVQVVNVAGRLVPHGACLDIHANVLAALLRVRRVQLADQLGGIRAGVLRQDARHELQAGGVLLDGVLRQPRLGARHRRQARRHLDLRRTRTRNQASVLAHRLVRVDAIVDGTLHVVHHIVCRRAQHNGRHARARLLARHDGARATNLLHVDGRHVAQLLGARRHRLDHACGADHAAQAAQLKLGHDLDHHHAVALQEVQRHLRDGRARHHNARARIVDGLDVRLHLVLLRARVALQLLGALDQHRALGLSGRRLHTLPEDGHLDVLEVLHRSLSVALDHQPLHHAALIQRTAGDL